MTRLFELRPDEEYDTWNDATRLTHALGLPGVRCDSCGRTWAMTGPSFPGVVWPATLDPGPFLIRDPIPSGRLSPLIDQVRSLVASGTPLYPGSNLGPGRGRLRPSTKGPDFSFCGPWCLLATSSAAAAVLNEMGVGAVDVELHKQRPPAPAVLQEVAIPLAGALIGAIDPDVPGCPTCGWRKRSLPAILSVRLDPGVPPPILFRTADFPTLLLATDPFVDAVRARRLTGLVFTPVDVTHS